MIKNKNQFQYGYKIFKNQLKHKNLLTNYPTAHCP